ncbi:MAG: class I SAM-dependent methyltransferase, partial [Candidatus Omnitrophica bacterium]|nr:class I SAM-dependent methyltransferase [Candidatus Omnitrophota bacterium]
KEKNDGLTRAQEVDFMRRLSDMAEVNFALNLGKPEGYGSEEMFFMLLTDSSLRFHPEHIDLVAALEYINSFGVKDDERLAFLVYNSERILKKLETLKETQDDFGKWLMRQIVDRMIVLSDKATSETYARMAQKYTIDHSAEPKGEDLLNLQKLMVLIEENISLDIGEKVEFLDVGTGLRDMSWLSKRDELIVHGIDKSAPLMRLIKEKLGAKVDARPMDMNDLEYGDGEFHVVRSQASLHHFLLIDEEQGLDIVYREINRVLKLGGLFYIHTKAEDGDRRKGIQIIDTNEGFGSRVYQHASEEILRPILERNGLEPITEFKEWKDWRGDNNVIVVARKIRTVKTIEDKNKEFIQQESRLSKHLRDIDKYWEWVHFRMRDHRLYDYRIADVEGEHSMVVIVQKARGVFDIHVKKGRDIKDIDLVHNTYYRGCINIDPHSKKPFFSMNNRHVENYPWIQEFILNWLSEENFVSEFVGKNQGRLDIPLEERITRFQDISL